MNHPLRAVSFTSRPSCRSREFKLTLPSVANDRMSAAFPSALEALKAKLLHQALQTFCEAHFESPLRHAAEQAARLALATEYPLLTFPELFRELAIPAMAKSEFRAFAKVGFEL